KAVKSAFKNLSAVLDEAYQEIEKTPYSQAFEKTLYYPSKAQLKAEFYYYHYPIAKIAIVFYLIALIALFFGKTLKKKSIGLIGFIFLSGAFLLHTALLLMRTFILNRPPVSNMFETVLYVPWIAMVAGFIFYLFEKNRWLLITSSFSSLFLLILLELTGMHQQLENVQAVLDSNYWLTIHVLLIVGSYGIFVLCGLLGQIYLGYTLFYPGEKEEMKFLSKFILQTMYLGVFMLIPGTLLGGVWAAESWGRFWDWDPKESWAFISSSIYLAFIHGYRFHKISSFGLSLGAVIGLMAISFTWYGVNYILGTGLHSYGFGTGKDIYYYSFLLLQTAFLIIVSIKHQKRLELKSKNLL
ncbi:MAG TPA: cytochrome c biogenesis protein CcsA, partial [Parachlamydiaceae bacterium]|nr:cytochrome c biogenesis protein CcsA [Parachlamydiaceae bacterium]